MELTNEQKIAILHAQRKVLAAQITLQTSQKQLETSHAEFTGFVNQLASELKLDPTKHRLDLDNLTIVDISTPQV